MARGQNKGKIMAFLQRTHTCGALREEHVGQTVVLNGWVNTARAYNDQVFVDLRDRYGITQIVFEAEDDRALFDAAHELRSEWVLAIKGKVRERLPGKHNPKLSTGDIEVEALELQVLNRCPTPPFEVRSIPVTPERFADPELANEDLRLEHRFLDLRRPGLQHTLAMRHRLNKVIRDHLDAQGFLELETPLLGRSTPEGARDYLVPSRIFPGQWYALPQSPQLYKQLLMVAGYDKYFQIAHCMRDEDLRADRQPEFTQLDLEMSFVERDDIFRVLEGLTAEIFRRCLGVEIPLPLPRLNYADCMLRYGSDKPDLRYSMEIVEVSDIAARSTLSVFQETTASGGVVRALNAKNAAEQFSRKKLDELTEFVRRCGAGALGWIKVEAVKLNSPLEKFLPPDVQQELRQRLGAEPGDLLLLVADREGVVCQALGNLRTHLAAQLKLYTNWWERRAEHDQEQEGRFKAYEKRAKDALKEGKPTPPCDFLPPFRPTADDFKPAWVIDFPSFIWDDEEKRWAANHHPFTAPRDEDLPLLETDPGKVRAKAYDLVLNGYEVGGGSIRIHDPGVQQRVFSVLGMSEADARQRFGFLLNALSQGAPPHGGIALGLDRFTMMLAGTTNIRDVIAFPKNQRARDLMTDAPAPVDARQLKELGL
ncbi:MAG TPA: aspartate--tRNA ligase [Gemmataceae bacterium]|nr:aspartate--tRNA ligase [Gemmataceae bacterium]